MKSVTVLKNTGKINLNTNAQFRGQEKHTMPRKQYTTDDWKRDEQAAWVRRKKMKEDSDRIAGLIAVVVVVGCFLLWPYVNILKHF